MILINNEEENLIIIHTLLLVRTSNGYECAHTV